MAGTPADLRLNYDSNTYHDHTYYGRGCSNGWGTDGEGGSVTPCSDSDAGGRIVKTADNEDLENGTYYTFQAGTSGTGRSVETPNANSSDTFCPLGWRLPYSGTGGDYYDKSKSWKYLLTTYNYAEATQANSNKIKSYPISVIPSGYFDWVTGRLYYQTTHNMSWSSTISSITGAYRFVVWKDGANPVDTTNMARGATVRCVCTFIDGTVAGTPADLTLHKDTNSLHDHTYEGNGCPTTSTAPCLDHIVSTYDNENQKNGTYYTFQASTSGSGAGLSAKNTNAPDTFCPLGWQLPYSGTGGDYYDQSKSWKYLFDTYGFPVSAEGSNQIKSYPLSYIPSGWFLFNDGQLNGITNSGTFKSSTVGQQNAAYRTIVGRTMYAYNENNGHAMTESHAIRCI